ncbi:MAG: hypothetical protein MJ078_02395, partial [Clostridia bacterium]|nr:hypothetical protein [Clostridia bacterium]
QPVSFSQEGEKNLLTDLAGSAVLTDCTEDFILPDYLPEIRKLLWVDVKATQNAPYVSPDRVSFSGSLYYTLLYTGSDGKLTAAPLRSDYEYSVGVKDAAPESLYTEEQTEAPVCRPQGPRKVNIRCKLHALPHIWVKTPVQTSPEKLSSLPENELEKLTEYHPALDLCYGDSGEETTETVFILEGVQPESLDIKYATAELLTESAVPEDGKMRYKGTLCLKMMLEKAPDAPFLLTKKVPVDCEVALTNCTPKSHVIAKGYTLSAEAELSEEDENTHILFRTVYVVKTLCLQNNETPFIKDVYSPVHQLICSPKDTSFFTYLGSYQRNYTLTGAGKPTLGDLDGENTDTQMLDAKCVFQNVEAKIENNACLFTGDVKALVSLINYGEDGSYRVQPGELVFPLRIRADLSAAPEEDDVLLYRLDPVCAEATFEKGDLSVKCEAALLLYVLRKSSCTVPDNITVSEEEKTEKSGDIRIFYPTSSDSLWSVGKKYRMPLSEILAVNQMDAPEKPLSSPESLDGYLWLLIES